MKQDILTLSATEAARRVSGGALSARELIEACLSRIDEWEPRVHAWAHMDRDLAVRQAEAVDAKVRAGRVGGKLCGIPVGVKDIFNTADMPTQMGSPIWRGFTPGNDARTVFSLRMADAVIPGKTVTAEFAVHTPGPTLNPYDPDCMAGTSSTGSAVAVACGMVPLALGTQTAGSIIRPASYNGVFGFKPSFGLIPRTGMLKTTDSLDTIGLFTRAPQDLKLLFDAIRVHGHDYPLSHSALADPARQERGDRPWRVAVVRGPKWEAAEPYARTGLGDFADRIRTALKADVREAEGPPGLRRAHDLHATIYDRTLAYYFREEFKKHTLVSPIMYEIITRGNRITLDQYTDALSGQSLVAREMDDFFLSGVDVVLNLSTGGEPLKGREAVDRPDNCLIWTLCGLPAVSLPVFTGPNGLPFGAQVVARRYNDYLLLSFVNELAASGLVPRVAGPESPRAVRAA